MNRQHRAQGHVRRGRRSRAFVVAPLLACQVWLSGCSEEPVAAPAAAAPRTRGAAEKAAPAAEEEAPAPPRVEFAIDFSEASRTRDPFQSYARDFADEAKKRVRSQREVVLDQYTLDELKLTGIVTRITPSRAMLVDPTGKGHVVHGGQFVGKAEIVQGGAGAGDYEINWRVDRVRENDIVLVREDPANPDVPSATRVIPLRPEDAIATR